MVDAGQARILGHLVDKLTDKRRSDLDLDALRKVKRLCKGGANGVIDCVFLLCMEKLKEQHSRTRLHALQLADELFIRSTVFRQLVAGTFTEFLELAVGFKHSRPLPDPPEDARILRERALESLEKWNEDFGSHIPQIRMGFDYLKDVLKFKFPELRNQQAQREAEAAAREARSREINAEKYEQIKETYISTAADVETTLDEMESSFRLLEGRPDPLPQGEDDEEWEDVNAGASQMAEEQHLGDEHAAGTKQAAASLTNGQETGSSLQTPEIRNRDPAIEELLQANYKLLVNKQLPMILDWLRVVVRADTGHLGDSEHARRERILRLAIKLRDRIGSVKAHCEALMAKLGEREKADGSSKGDLIISATAVASEQPSVHVHSGRTTSRGAQSQVSQASASAETKAGNLKDRAEKRRTPAKKELLEDVFGKDSDEEDGPSDPVRPSRRQRLAGPSSPLVKPPQYADPTYRRPENAALELENPPSPLQLRSLSSKDIQTSKLPSELKKKLLAEGPSLPAGTHLAYWDSDKASLLNNKGMEVYNHWGAVDENVQLPEHVISQFFTTRASYYDPTQKIVKREREEDTTPVPDDPPKKRPPRVTAIGQGAAATNKLSLPTLPLLPLVPARHQPARALLSSPDTEEPVLPPSKVGTALRPATPSDQQAQLPSAEKGALPASAAEKTHLPTAAVQPASPVEPVQEQRELIMSEQQTGVGKMQPRGRGGRMGSRGRARSSQRGTANQRALDRAHNEAILAGSTEGTDPSEPGASASARGITKPKPSVRQRLAAKLLTGGARDRAVSEVDAVENERIRDADSHRW